MNPKNTDTHFGPHPLHEPMEVDMPASLDDLTVAQIVEILYAITRAIENKYAAQLFRYYDPPDECQCHLWDDADLDDDDMPF